MSATVYYDSVNELAVLTMAFTNAAGAPTDPTTVSCTVTDPAGVAVIHTYGAASPADITRVSAGKFTLSVVCSPAEAGIDGLWGGQWNATGTVVAVEPVTWRVLPANTSQLWYVGIEEMKDRLGIVNDSTQDSSIQTALAASAGWINEYCVAMDTPVLTADLQWVPAGDLIPGQELVGVDEEPTASPESGNRLVRSNRSRLYRRATVLATPRRMAECVKLTLADGREVTCATDHKWLARWSNETRGRSHVPPGGFSGHGYQWVHARDIVPGVEIASPLRTWSDETSFEAGWVAGLFDGEGWLIKDGATHSTVGFAQNSGLVLDGVLKYLENASIPYTLEHSPKDACTRVMIAQRWAAMELLGRLRPRRLLPRAAALWEDRRIIRGGPNSAQVVAAEPDGLQEVVSMKTSTGTYIANGLISHNCGRHFNRITEARTFEPDNVWLLNVDDIATGAAITVTVDQDGDGIYEQALVKGTDYQLRIGDRRYNPNSLGQPRPYTQLQIIQSGNWFPFTWPYSHLDRVKILTSWGWPAVPWQVAEAQRILAADQFRMKDASFGIAGVGDLGAVKISSNPWLVENLRPFVRARHKVGI